MSHFFPFLLFAFGAAASIVSLIVSRRYRTVITDRMLVVIPVMMIAGLFAATLFGWITLPGGIVADIICRAYLGIAIGMLWARFVSVPR